MKKLLADLEKLKSQKDVSEDEGRASLNYTDKKYRIISDKIKGIIRESDTMGGKIRARSKEAINDSINDNLSKAKNLLDITQKELIIFNKKIAEILKHLKNASLISKLSTSDFQNISSKIDTLEKDFSEAKEEFFESKILYTYLLKGKIIESQRLPFVTFETYAGALSDFCGELVRKAKLKIIAHEKDKKDIYTYYETVKNVYETISNFSFSNKSGIRTKVEHLKGFIQKIEDFLYDLNKNKNNFYEKIDKKNEFIHRY